MTSEPPGPSVRESIQEPCTGETVAGQQDVAVATTEAATTETSITTVTPQTGPEIATTTSTPIATSNVETPAETTITINQDPTIHAESGIEQPGDCHRDNGIFDFMTPERAIELYKRIHSNGVPDLEWKFYGRRRLDEVQENERSDNPCDNLDDRRPESQGDLMHESLIQTEFDFDESFAELSTCASSIINDSLQLKNRPEPGSEKKTNLSDIMSHLMKEKSLVEEE